MSCSLCHGYGVSCPCCAEAPEPVPCYYCDGTGVRTWYDSDGNPITRQAWEQLPPEWKDPDSYEPCPYCNE